MLDTTTCFTIIIALVLVLVGFIEWLDRNRRH